MDKGLFLEGVRDLNAEALRRVNERIAWLEESGVLSSAVVRPRGSAKEKAEWASLWDKAVEKEVEIMLSQFLRYRSWSLPNTKSRIPEPTGESLGSICKIKKWDLEYWEKMPRRPASSRGRNYRLSFIRDLQESSYAGLLGAGECFLQDELSERLFYGDEVVGVIKACLPMILKIGRAAMVLRACGSDHPHVFVVGVKEGKLEGSFVHIDDGRGGKNTLMILLDK